MTESTEELRATAQFQNPTRVVFGEGALQQVRDLIPEGRMVIVTSAGSTRRGLVDRVLRLVGEHRATVLDQVTPNPEPPDLLRHLEAVPADANAVLVVGGGSVMDTGKILSALAGRRRLGRASGPLRELARGGTVGRGESLDVFAVPTTAGTGSEVTPFATVWDREVNRKASVAGPGLFPRLAVVDPELTWTLPEAVTISSGLDALSQGLEAWWNRNAGPVTDAFALRAVSLALESLEPLARNLEDRSLRSRMMAASLLSGLAISGTRTAIAHSISYPLTLHLGVPHGLACAFTLPTVLEFNLRGADSRISELASSLGMTSAQQLADQLREVLKALKVGTRLREYGLNSGQIVELGPEMVTPGRADNNLRNVNGDQAVEIALRSWNELAQTD